MPRMIGFPATGFDVKAFLAAHDEHMSAHQGEVWVSPGPTPWRYREDPSDDRDYFVEQPGWTEQIIVRGELEARAVTAILNWCHAQTAF